MESGSRRTINGKLNIFSIEKVLKNKKMLIFARKSISDANEFDKYLLLAVLTVIHIVSRCVCVDCSITEKNKKLVVLTMGFFCIIRILNLTEK